MKNAVGSLPPLVLNRLMGFFMQDAVQLVSKK